MTRLEALKAMENLMDAAMRHYRVTNGEARGKPENAAKAELKAARKVMNHLTHEDVSDEELSDALGW